MPPVAPPPLCVLPAEPEVMRSDDEALAPPALLVRPLPTRLLPPRPPFPALLPKVWPTDDEVAKPAALDVFPDGYDPPAPLPPDLPPLVPPPASASAEPFPPQPAASTMLLKIKESAVSRVIAAPWCTCARWRWASVAHQEHRPGLTVFRFSNRRWGRRFPERRARSLTCGNRFQEPPYSSPSVSVSSVFSVVLPAPTRNCACPSTTDSSTPTHPRAPRCRGMWLNRSWARWRTCCTGRSCRR